MTETEWLACKDPQKMLFFLQGKGRVSDRTVRLLFVASCYRIWDLLPHECSKQAVLTVERYVDELASGDELRSAYLHAHAPCVDFEEEMWRAADEGIQLIDGPSPGTEEAIEAAIQNEILASKRWNAALLPTVAAESNPAVSCYYSLHNYADECVLGDWACYLRDIFGNPFHSIAFIPNWLTPQVVALAQAIYDDRAFDSLPILADALEEAGCTNTDILNHCHQGGRHVRGCWVVDLILGKQ